MLRRHQSSLLTLLGAMAFIWWCIQLVTMDHHLLWCGLQHQTSLLAVIAGITYVLGWRQALIVWKMIHTKALDATCDVHQAVDVDSVDLPREIQHRTGGLIRRFRAASALLSAKHRIMVWPGGGAVDDGK